MSQPPWIAAPEIDLDLNLKPAVRYRDLPDSIIGNGQSLLAELLTQIPPEAKSVCSLMRVRTANRFHAEICALADAIGADWKDIAVANLSYDLAMSLFGCSTIAVPTPNGPIVARNMDWPQEDVLARCSCLIRYRRSDGLAFANAGWPGAVGAVTGLSGNGFCVVLNAVSGPEGVNKSGYPVLLHIRRVLEDASGFDEALKMLSKQKLVASCLLTLVGSNNDQRVVIERTPTQHALRWAEENRVLVTTNDYRLLFQPETHDGGEIYRTTCLRFDYLTQFFSSHDSASQTTEDKLLYALTDENVIQGITAQHIIMQPKTGYTKLYVPRKFVES